MTRNRSMATNVEMPPEKPLGDRDRLTTFNKYVVHKHVVLNRPSLHYYWSGQHRGKECRPPRPTPQPTYWILPIQKTSGSCESPCTSFNFYPKHSGFVFQLNIGADLPKHKHLLICVVFTYKWMMLTQFHTILIHFFFCGYAIIMKLFMSQKLRLKGG